MLRDIKSLLRERGRMSLRELSIHFDIETSALDPMMKTLIDSGQVKAINTWEESSCGGCAGCSLVQREDFVFYETVE